jgi:hypothetical protein
MSTAETPAAHARPNAPVRYIPDYKVGAPEMITEHLFVAVLEAVTFLTPDTNGAAAEPARTVEQHIAGILHR